jgi:hypothetical protein
VGLITEQKGFRRHVLRGTRDILLAFAREYWPHELKRTKTTDAQVRRSMSRCSQCKAERWTGSQVDTFTFNHGR